MYMCDVICMESGLQWISEQKRRRLLKQDVGMRSRKDKVLHVVRMHACTHTHTHTHHTHTHTHHTHTHTHTHTQRQRPHITLKFLTHDTLHRHMIGIQGGGHMYQ